MSDRLPDAASRPEARRPLGPGAAGGLLGVLGFGLAWIPTAGVVIGLVFGILAVIFAGVGLAADTRPRTIAAAGLVLGAATLVLTLIPGLHGL